MKVTFCGAARIVTGSCYLIETGNDKVLIDCGMFQGLKEVTRMNYEPFAFNPEEISHVFLTHAHIDHSGLIPKLFREGFRGQVITTSATKDLCKVMLMDSAKMHVAQTAHENRRRERVGDAPRKPLYTPQDAREVMKLFKAIEYDSTYEITDNIDVRYRDAGHILGSAIIEFFAEDKKLVFSGDLGQWDSPIVRDPTLIEEADYLWIESTYGDRIHEKVEKKAELLLQYANEAYKKGGKLLVPSFAIERTQEVLYTIKKLKKAGNLPSEKVFLDSPLAIKATEVFKKHREAYDTETLKLGEPFTFDNLVYTSNVNQSIRLNTYADPCIIIAGSGMCTGGRIRHHLKHGLWNPKNTLLFVGYQAEGTLGRIILDGAKEVRMMGLDVAVKADIRRIEGFSAHADYRELLKWAGGFKKKPIKTFVVHGEPEASESLKTKLEAKGFKCRIPSIYESVEL